MTTTEPTNITPASAVCGGTVTAGDGSHVFARGLCWNTSPNPVYDDNHTSDGTSTGSLNDTLEGLSPNTTYYVRAYVVSDSGLSYGNEVSFTTLENGSGGIYAYVDLGLPSGLLWAICNVGAISPEESGDYFAWGEIQPKEYYDWSTYQYCNGTENTLTKYCWYSGNGYNGFTDNLIVLEPEDDAATANWSTDWRMPTEEEWVELYQNTTTIWTTWNGVFGLLFTASNNNSIFMPATGYRRESDFYFVGVQGNYWSSSLSLGRPEYARSFNFNSAYVGIGGCYRRAGQCIRPVRSSE